MGRNPFNQTIHHERQQPKSMRGLGKLERRKDFVKRAHIRKLQEETTAYLKRKASNKNPDEFNCKMQNMRLQGKVVIDIRPKEGQSAQELERLLMIQKNALVRLQKKKIFIREKRIVFNEEGKGIEMEPIDLVDVSKIKEKIDAQKIIEEQEKRQQEINKLQKEIKITERKLQEISKIEREQDKRKKIEIKDEYGDVIATHYQNTRKK
ncbi:U3 small nucleolar RNA-associated protein 11, putative [Entamoeba nuttalli P19]|uniref:U3 small nucleolar RNA-associated protein 11, putative n=1 Tax=Entamoeba nuttalli (strain P19) TaxID=1076696 RepID=K2H5F5_ENTNP|nr:U3 small nucleolar RNA-associated protein 11, putative [Entamoeba nuttalli P19]EKE37669.1 U3 small nucleolar RNA-associated protein 11, putative [Entamoeba nuttalli P19]|eukprot:XP_008859991.1 U3 small nucleolar RNA-associated protein 11, putative [Entamoeba nuttalli P19]